MPISFPTSPADNEVYTYDGLAWKYSFANNTWTSVAGSVFIPPDPDIWLAERASPRWHADAIDVTVQDPLMMLVTGTLSVPAFPLMARGQDINGKPAFADPIESGTNFCRWDTSGTPHWVLQRTVQPGPGVSFGIYQWHSTSNAQFPDATTIWIPVAVAPFGFPTGTPVTFYTEGQLQVPVIRLREWPDGTDPETFYSCSVTDRDELQPWWWGVSSDVVPRVFTVYASIADGASRWVIKNHDSGSILGHPDDLPALSTAPWEATCTMKLMGAFFEPNTDGTIPVIIEFVIGEETPGGSTTTVSDTAPLTPQDGDTWRNSANGQTYVRQGGVWVGGISAAPAPALPPAVTPPDFTENGGTIGGNVTVQGAMAVQGYMTVQAPGTATRFFLISNENGSNAPEFHYTGHNQEWISGIDVANNNGGTDYVIVGYWNATAQTVTDFIYVSRNKAGTGVDPHGFYDDSGFPTLQIGTGATAHAHNPPVVAIGAPPDPAAPCGDFTLRDVLAIRCSQAAGLAGTTKLFFFYDSGGVPRTWFSSNFKWNKLDTSGTLIVEGQTTLSTTQAALADNSAMTRKLHETYVNPDAVILRDYFCGGNQTSGSLGQLGWLSIGTGQPYSLNYGASGGGLTLAPPAITSSLPIAGIHLFAKNTAGGGAGQPAVGRLLGRYAGTSLKFRWRSNVYAYGTTAFSCGIGNNQFICDRIMSAKSLGIAYMPVPTTYTVKTYAVGEVVKPTTPNGLAYICTTGGAAAVEPVWPTAYGGTVTDGAAVFTCSGKAGSNTGKFIFYVCGGNDPLVGTLTAESTVGVTATDQVYNAEITFDATNAYFSINGETPVALAWAGLDAFSPFFVTRNDTNNTGASGASAWWLCQLMAMTVLDRY